MTLATKQEKLATLSTTLLSNLDEDLFFSQITKHIQEVFNDYKVLFFETLSDGSTELRAENGLVANHLKYEKGKGLSGYVSRVKRGYYSNSKSDPLLSTSKRDDCVISEIAVPVMEGDIVLGTLHIQSSCEERKFSENDLTEILDILSNLKSAIKNMRILLMAKNLNRELEAKLSSGSLQIASKVKNDVLISPTIDVIGHSNNMVSVSNLAKRVAREDFPIMLNGSRGVGKKLIAKRIHQLSDRRASQCIVVHCSAITEEQLNIELFGSGERAGIFEIANGGTIILDAVEQLPHSIQSKILRTIVSGEAYRLNSDSARKVDVRIISTTSTNIKEAIESGLLREDLLYRLNIVSITIPELNERLDDIKVLSEYFLNIGKDSNSTKMLTSGAIEKLSKYNWPGNVRELRNIMERTAIMVEERYIDASHLPELHVEEEVVQDVVEEIFEEMSLHELEKIHICKTLEHLGGNKTKAAKSLGITVKTLYNKLHSYGLVHSKNE